MNPFEEQYGFTTEEWANCLKVLNKLKDQPFNNPDNQRFGALVTKIHKNAKKQVKQSNAKQQKQADLKLSKSSQIAKNALNNTTQFAAQTYQQTPVFSTLNKAKNCYACNQPYHLLHSFYHRLCPSCATINYDFRFLETNLSNRQVILTGGRVKVGYATALKVLRSQAHLTITTRFPALALQQFQQEKDYPIWKERLDIYGLDLRNLKAVEEFIQNYHDKHDSLDILINNAAQTIKYEENYYQPLIANERLLNKQLSANHAFVTNKTPILQSVMLDETATDMSEFPLNRFGQPIDERLKNSWNATLEEVSTLELLEVNLINHIAPYLLIKHLTPLMKQSNFKEKFIINVTSSEGQFSYSNKTIFHPHTNMTKAALNMLTRTSALEYVKHRIYMTAVDVGWISTGAHETLRKKQFEQAYIPPLDSVDGAARILHPVHEGINQQNYFAGQLLKNYQVTDW